VFLSGSAHNEVVMPEVMKVSEVVVPEVMKERLRRSLFDPI
jgi:hypothetical protein